MIFALVILGIVIMSVMIYMAVDKKSNSATRKASLIALAVMVVTVIICLFRVFTENTVALDPSRADQVTIVEPEKAGGNMPVLFLLVIFLIAIFVTVLVVSIKENKKHKGETVDNRKPVSNW